MNTAMIGSLLGTDEMVQVGFIVRDIEETKKKYAEFFGVPVPPSIEGTGGEERFCVTKTKYKGKPSPKINAKLAFFHVGGAMDIELIEPNEEPSVWRDYLEKFGEGQQHVAFVVDSIDECVKKCEEAFGMTVVQEGYFEAGDGRYAYLAAEDTLKTVIELLERW